MKRRNFIQNGIALAAGSFVASNAFGRTARRPVAEPTFNINYAPHDGMFANHAGKDFV
jgi:hydroxypyruvate isomerase